MNIECHFLYSGPLMIFVELGPIVAALINRFGCRTVAITGSLLASLAMFVSSFATNMDFLLCTFGVLAGELVYDLCIAI